MPNPSFSSTSWSTTSFSPISWDFGQLVGDAPGNTPGFKKNLRGMRAPIRGEDDEQKRQRRLAQGIPLAAIEGGPPKPVEAPMDPKQKRLMEITARLRAKSKKPK